jgi:O-antigen/teichoic acid export membrane protein
LQADPATLAARWVRGLRLIFSATMVAVAVAVFLRRELVFVLLGERFAAAADPFGLLAIGFALVVLGYFCAIALYGIGDFETQRRYYMVAAVAMLLAAWPLIAAWGILGCAVLYLGARCVDVAFLHATLRRMDLEPPAWSMAVASLLFCATMAFAWAGWPALAALSLVAFLVSIGWWKEWRAWVEWRRAR